ncbi:hypothetical protein [Bosea sp. LC85]|uniref:hypothetical protein n=1 Tax=Bosea sp. LC85 TaxID=1502851 RepID=UPI0006963D48|nr:hypothetical protein [Bosea sp. LC85]
MRLSERNRRFLSFVVTQTVAGHSDRIKAYAIGVDVFGRDDSFDPGTDPIVRIEATRLRSALATYYETAGANVPVRIAIPPGSYVPSFTWHSSDTGPTESTPPVNTYQAASANADLPAIVIKNLTDRAVRLAAAHGDLFTETLIKRLATAGFRLFAMPSVERRAAAIAIGKLLLHPDETYALDIAVHPMSAGQRFSWCATDLRSGEIICSDFVDEAERDVPCASSIDTIAAQAAESVSKALGG